MVRALVSFPVHKFPADADVLLLGEEAREVLAGGIRVFLIGNRIGALSTYPVAALIGLFGPGRFALALYGFLAAVVLLAVWYLFLRELLGARPALLALPLAALPTPALLFWLYMPNGYAELMIACAAVLWLAVRAAHRGWTPPLCAALGLAIGIGAWCSFLTLPVTTAALGWALLLRRPDRSRWPKALAAMFAATALGFLPWLAYNLRYGFPSLGDSLATRPVSTLQGAAENLTYLLRHRLPELLVAIDPGATRALVLPLQRQLAFLPLVLCALALAMALGRSARAGAERPFSPRQVAALTLSVLALVALANVVSAPGGLRVLSVRYVLPVFLVVPALFGAALAGLGARVRRAGAAAIALLCLFWLLGVYWPWQAPRQLWRLQADEDARILARLEASGIEVLLGPYWLSFPFTYLSDGRVRGVPLEAEYDYLGVGRRLPVAPLRWALAAYREERLAPWRERFGLADPAWVLTGGRAFLIPAAPPRLDPPGPAGVEALRNVAPATP